MTKVLYAHPDRWTIHAEFPPEECARMRTALTGFAVEWLGWKSPAKLTHGGTTVEETDDQRATLAAFRDRAREFGGRARRIRARRGATGLDPRPVVESALDAVVTGALWESPTFLAKDGALAFHRAWRLLLEITPADEPALTPLALRWHLIVRSK